MHTNMDILTTIVDKANRPLCFMPFSEAVAQKLIWRSVAVLLQTIDAMHILRWNRPFEMDLPLFSPLPAFQSEEEYCLQYLSSLLGDNQTSLKKTSVMAPCEANQGSFMAIYQGKCPGFKDDPNSPLFSADAIEMIGLKKAGCKSGPLLDLFFPQANP